MLNQVQHDKLEGFL